jgi:hypothetical protein
MIDKERKALHQWCYQTAVAVKFMDAATQAQQLKLLKLLNNNTKNLEPYIIIFYCMT